MQRYESFNFSPIFLEASNYFVLQQITINGEDEEQRKSKKIVFFLGSTKSRRYRNFKMTKYAFGTCGSRGKN